MLNLLHSSLLANVIWLLALQCAIADFVYPDFNDTSTLYFLGDAATTSCDKNDEAESGTAVVSELIKTNVHSESAGITQRLSILGHRTEFAESPNATCPIRLRLTSSRPFRRGAVWRETPVPVLRGFETGFTFQVTDQSRVCRIVRDKDFSTRQYQSCIVHGGDGLAFVMHMDSNKSHALGEGGEQLGYAGIKNALVVELDTWYNPDIGDLFADHVTVLASGPSMPLVSNMTQALADAKSTPLADGRIHSVKVQYFPYIKYNVLPHFSAAPPLIPFLKDAGEGRRVGTLLVFVDDMTTPLVAMPFNLNVAMRMPQGQAWIGFTSATGRAWQRHDVLSWYFCEAPGCPRAEHDVGLVQQSLDFGVQDEVN